MNDSDRETRTMNTTTMNVKQGKRTRKRPPNQRQHGRRPCRAIIGGIGIPHGWNYAKDKAEMNRYYAAHQMLICPLKDLDDGARYSCCLGVMATSFESLATFTDKLLESLLGDWVFEDSRLEEVLTDYQGLTPALIQHLPASIKIAIIRRLALANAGKEAKAHGKSVAEWVSGIEETLTAVEQSVDRAGQVLGHFLQHHEDTCFMEMLLADQAVWQAVILLLETFGPLESTPPLLQGKVSAAGNTPFPSQATTTA